MFYYIGGLATEMDAYFEFRQWLRDFPRPLLVRNGWTSSIINHRIPSKPEQPWPSSASWLYCIDTNDEEFGMWLMLRFNADPHKNLLTNQR